MPVEYCSSRWPGAGLAGKAAAGGMAPAHINNNSCTPPSLGNNCRGFPMLSSVHLCCCAAAVTPHLVLPDA